MKRTQLMSLIATFSLRMRRDRIRFQLIVAGVMSQSGNLPHFLLVEIIVQSLQHSVESHFRSIRYKGKTVWSYPYRWLSGCWNQFLTQQFTFLINIHITAAAEIDTLERTRLHLARLVDLGEVRSLPSLLINKACPGCSS